MFFVQTPEQVMMIAQHDNDVRRIYLNVPHSKGLKPSWYGESVGHYEGDTLVIDTIGLNDKTFVDNFRTPHSDKLHVVERLRLVEDGKFLEADITIDDPAVFLAPLHVDQALAARGRNAPGVALRRRRNEQSFRKGSFDPLPVAQKPDF